MVITESLPAPIGGWNARDSLALMKPEQAVILDNWIPTPGGCQARNGYSKWSTSGVSGNVETLMTWAGPSSAKMFGIVGAPSNAIYDMTAGGAIGAAVQSGLTNARWQWTQFSTSAGHYLIACNGADKVRLYDGAAWEAQDGASAHAITGVTTTTLINVNIHKRRVWFVEANSTRAWFLPVDSIAGAATSLELGGLWSDGGYLVSMATWTLDAGSGVDDYAVFFSSRGEVAIYQGTDPSSATTWKLQGNYKLGSAVSRRNAAKIGGDIALISQDGFFPLSLALQSTRLVLNNAISDTIKGAATEATQLYGSHFGWQIFLYPTQNLLIFNVPAIESTVSYQYVMNTQTRAWCRFTGLNAFCWVLFNDVPYFGTINGVMQAFQATTDDGAPIRTDALQAFNYFGKRARKKQFTMARATFTSDPGLNSEAVVMGLNIDFKQSALTTTPTYTGATASGTWDAGLWDTALWAGVSTGGDWQKVIGIGYCAGVRMRTAAQQNLLLWVATDLIMELGGPF